MTDQFKMDSGTQGDKTGSSPAAPCMAGMTETCNHNRRYVDITAMIRSLQRTEGLTDCFRRGNADCDQTECAWRQYCLGNAKDVLMDTNA
ncbi:hypothetical protein [Desulfatitalea alkaliphila]|uniref:Uncharacterized protein n=1 Tax=Desulfatitalea alkaliphila TaxID=2929485 RepID=A0AA41UIM0_9BACT|nr:hypothetical protein [Desulfatitalea alkaliphila]MCJ8499692.1 hypothetical protein [Desulfatitalea alkaliphila]